MASRCRFAKISIVLPLKICNKTVETFYHQSVTIFWQVTNFLDRSHFFPIVTRSQFFGNADSPLYCCYYYFNTSYGHYPWNCLFCCSSLFLFLLVVMSKKIKSFGLDLIPSLQHGTTLDIMRLIICNMRISRKRRKN